ncbi:MAG TPA: DUF6457 domain-containing protein [Candidatus Dormibacteraeota bacterium]|jgi:hypothetical protein|nr:DUF6457 domain-containing protein [Candidatus Dormibacteraeota bacterium]
MNPWLDRFAEGLDPTPGALTRDEAALVLDLAGVTARGAGARQFAPLAAYLAGRAAATLDDAARVALLQRAVELAGGLGAATDPLGLD